MFEQMFVMDEAPKAYLRPRRRPGWGRVVLLATALLGASARIAYSGGPAGATTVVVAPGDTVWSIAAAHYSGDPRPRVDAILRLNHLEAPILLPGQTLQIPAR